MLHRDVADVEERPNLHAPVLLVQAVLVHDVLPLRRRDTTRRVVRRAVLDVLELDDPGIEEPTHQRIEFGICVIRQVIN